MLFAWDLFGLMERLVLFHEVQCDLCKVFIFCKCASKIIFYSFRFTHFILILTDEFSISAHMTMLTNFS